MHHSAIFVCVLQIILVVSVKSVQVSNYMSLSSEMRTNFNYLCYHNVKIERTNKSFFIIETKITTPRDDITDSVISVISVISVWHVGSMLIQPGEFTNTIL